MHFYPVRIQKIDKLTKKMTNWFLKTVTEMWHEILRTKGSYTLGKIIARKMDLRWRFGHLFLPRSACPTHTHWEAYSQATSIEVDFIKCMGKLVNARCTWPHLPKWQSSFAEYFNLGVPFLFLFFLLCGLDNTKYYISIRNVQAYWDDW